MREKCTNDPQKRASPQKVPCSWGGRHVVQTPGIWMCDLKGPQRAEPVVVPEGPAAGGGAWLIAVDPGVPLGPSLPATCVPPHGPHTINANSRMKAQRMTANVRPLTLPSVSFSRIRFSFDSEFSMLDFDLPHRPSAFRSKARRTNRDRQALCVQLMDSLDVTSDRPRRHRHLHQVPGSRRRRADRHPNDDGGARCIARVVHSCRNPG